MQNTNRAALGVCAASSIMGISKQKSPALVAQGICFVKKPLDCRSQRSGLGLQIAQHSQILPQ
jgi:hypothetical protein